MLFRLLLILCVIFGAQNCGGNDAKPSDSGTPVVDATLDSTPPSLDLSVSDQSTTSDAKPPDQVPPPPTVDAVADAGPVDVSSPPDLGVPSDGNPGSEVQSNPLPDLTTLDLNGSIPQASVAVPSFNALNSDGSARGPSDLMGKPTIMWFFPIAGTPG